MVIHVATQRRKHTRAKSFTRHLTRPLLPGCARLRYFVVGTWERVYKLRFAHRGTTRPSTPSRSFSHCDLGWLRKNRQPPSPQRPERKDKTTNENETFIDAPAVKLSLANANSRRAVWTLRHPRPTLPLFHAVFVAEPSTYSPERFLPARFHRLDEMCIITNTAVGIH